MSGQFWNIEYDGLGVDGLQVWMIQDTLYSRRRQGISYNLLTQPGHDGYPRPSMYVEAGHVVRVTSGISSWVETKELESKTA